MSRTFPYPAWKRRTFEKIGKWYFLAKQRTLWWLIKKRYNHSITNVNPDATFGNNLDNIIEGLTQSFTSHYGIELLENNKYNLEIPNYVKAGDKKFYKYNFEFDNVYYCPNNTIIVNGEVKTFDKDKYLVFDHFVLDLENKKNCRL